MLAGTNPNFLLNDLITSVTESAVHTYTQKILDQYNTDKTIHSMDSMNTLERDVMCLANL